MAVIDKVFKIVIDDLTKQTKEFLTHVILVKNLAKLPVYHPPYNLQLETNNYWTRLDASDLISSSTFCGKLQFFIKNISHPIIYL